MADPVVPSGLNTLTIPARHLPLGRATDCPAGASRWTVWIPSRFGGRLSVALEKAAAIDTDAPTDEASSIKIKFVTDEVVAEGSGKAGYDVPMNKWGELIVVVENASGGSIVARFTQTYWSRQGRSLSAAPLIPYNFWFWPCSRGEKWAVGAKAVLTRYGIAVGKSSPDPAVFEHEFHQLNHAPLWQGHCHNAAPASALFEQPVTQGIGGTWNTIFGGSFSSDELKLMATEFVGNFGQVEDVWYLSSSIRMTPQPRFSLLAYVKPNGPKSRVALVSGLTQAVGATAAEIMATDAITAAGGDDAFATRMDQDFGASAATFLATLQNRIAVQGEPLVTNLRVYSSAGGPEEVWNQVCFHYSATFMETQGEDDKLDMWVVCNLTSNRDLEPPTDSPPARVVSDRVEPGVSNQDCMQYFHQFRLIFSRDGTINESDTRNRWISVTSSSGDALYAPAYMQRIKAVLKARPDTTTPEESMASGNPVVGQELLDEISFNARFR